METTNNNLFGVNLRRVINKLGVTYAKAADDIGISLSFLNQLMRGESTPSLAMVFQICEKLSCSPNELFTDQENVGPSKSDQLLALFKIAPTLNEDQLSGLLKLAAAFLSSSGPDAASDLGDKNNRFK